MAPRIMDVATGMNTALGPGADDHFPGWENVELVVPGVDEVGAWISAYQKSAPAFSEKEARLFPLVCAALWAIWGHPPMDDARIDGGSLVVDYMRCLLEDVWELAARLRR